MPSTTTPEQRLDRIFSDLRSAIAEESAGGPPEVVDVYLQDLEHYTISLARLLARIATLVPRLDSWDGGPGRLEDLANMLDRSHVPRPDHSAYQRH